MFLLHWVSSSSVVVFPHTLLHCIVYTRADITQKLLFVVASSFFPNIILYYYLFFHKISVSRDFVYIASLHSHCSTCSYSTRCLFFCCYFGYQNNVLPSLFIYFFRFSLHKKVFLSLFGIETSFYLASCSQVTANEIKHFVTTYIQSWLKHMHEMVLKVKERNSIKVSDYHSNVIIKVCKEDVKANDEVGVRFFVFLILRVSFQ